MSALPAGTSTVTHHEREARQSTTTPGVGERRLVRVVAVLAFPHAALLALALLGAGAGRLRRRVLLIANGAAVTILMAWGGVSILIGALLLGGVITPDGSLNEHVQRWHVFFWDPWFVVWGCALGAGRRALSAADGMTIAMTAIGEVRGGRVEAVDDDRAAVEAMVGLDPQQFGPDALAGLGEFSHLEVVYVFLLVSEAEIERGSRHPRGNLQWPRVGILARSAKNRPNRPGVSCCELLGVDGRCLAVRALDAIDGTPVLDIKPWMAQFAPQQPTRQPSWSSELMTGYWSASR